VDTASANGYPGDAERRLVKGIMQGIRKPVNEAFEFRISIEAVCLTQFPFSAMVIELLTDQEDYC
jgi:hypothetical protein